MEDLRHYMETYGARRISEVAGLSLPTIYNVAEGKHKPHVRTTNKLQGAIAALRTPKPKLPHIWKYLRDKHGRKIGVAIAVLHEGHIGIGWSKCKTKGARPDTFDRAIGTAIARGRALKHIQRGREVLNGVPQSMRPFLRQFVKSAYHYYRGGESCQ